MSGRDDIEDRFTLTSGDKAVLMLLAVVGAVVCLSMGYAMGQGIAGAAGDFVGMIR